MTVPTIGFRFSRTDGVVLLTAFVFSFVLLFVSSMASIMVLFIVLHFFLFCNVFRIRRNFEVIWSLIFVFQMIMNSSLNLFSWFIPLLLQLFFTVFFCFFGDEVIALSRGFCRSH